LLQSAAAVSPGEAKRSWVPTSHTATTQQKARGPKPGPSEKWSRKREKKLGERTAVCAKKSSRKRKGGSERIPLKKGPRGGNRSTGTHETVRRKKKNPEGLGRRDFCASARSKKARKAPSEG